MALFKKFILSVLAIAVLGVVYYFFLKWKYFDPDTGRYTDSSLNENIFLVMQDLLSVNFNGKVVNIFSLSINSLLHFIVSFASSVILGVSIGVVIGTNKVLGRISNYFINFFRVLPSIVFIVIFKYQLKFQENHIYFVGTIACIWPIIINTKSGVEKVNKTLREAISILNIPKFKKLFLFTLPEAFPNIWDGIKTSLGIAFLITITCEYLTQQLYGLGSILWFYDENVGNVSHSMLIILWIGFLGVLTNFILEYFENKLIWLKNQFSTDEE